MERLGIKLVVTEVSGIRRFLYPLNVKLPSVYRRSAGKLALADDAGNLTPSYVSASGASGDVRCVFALSLAPLETRELFLVRLDGAAPAPVPDPLHVRVEPGGVTSRQERVSFSLDMSALLTACVYDGVEHLAGQLSITLDGEPMRLDAEAGAPKLVRPPGGLFAEQSAVGVYPGPVLARTAGQTVTELTCCKSWVNVRHALQSPRAGSILRFSLPLAVTSTIQTCDFGAGNGAYGKLQPGVVDQIVWETDLSLKNAARYRIRTRSGSGDLRTDYAGEIRNAADLASRLWLHWNEPSKALALAITDIARGCERAVVRLNAGGLIEVEFALGPTISDPAEFGVCYHFLNDIPPIAAATNPASILSPPMVSVVKSAI